MKYIVIEIQTTSQGQVSSLTTAFDTELEALGKFHTILASATQSSLACHTAMIVSEDGLTLRSECIKHGEVTE